MALLGSTGALHLVAAVALVAFLATPIRFTAAKELSQQSENDAVAEVEALTHDDQCAGGDMQCSLSVLQLRGAAVLSSGLSHVETQSSGQSESEENIQAEDGAGESMSIRRRRTSQTEDLSVAWTQKIYAWAVYINKNVTLIDWKLYYMNMDIKSTNDSLFHNPNATVGVNG
eukprot:CAMPEP_0115223266 /NCGR_PEP_ID=MMETSP0270-20121206/28956_1 /TAXON_ID=71861 /ORGANISM="Scrippsiella trochoidea, Strain CCMP3099" /LENGTH=171 /DNA_ID=CAMNT_0002637511 /DNA_START=55 /DNA_END=566 /DNA_ORIENTATION=+